MTDSICVVLMCNDVEHYINGTLRTIKELREIGKYDNDIVLMYGDDLIDRMDNPENIFTLELNNLSVIKKYFPTINRSKYIEMFINKPFGSGDKREITKSFQFHKFYLFTDYFKQWEKIFYIDAGMHIIKPIYPMITLKCNNTLLAHSDAYPFYNNELDCQFDKLSYPEVFNKLKNNFNLNIDYFQTTIMLFDTNIIKNNTFDELIKLSEEYFISKTNEQGILNLLFNCKLGLWKQITSRDKNTYYYDFWERPKRNKNNYIMLKRIRFG